MEAKTIPEQTSLLDTLAPGKRTRLRRLLFEFDAGSVPLIEQIKEIIVSRVSRVP